MWRGAPDCGRGTTRAWMWRWRVMTVSCVLPSMLTVGTCSPRRGFVRGGFHDPGGGAFCRGGGPAGARRGWIRVRMAVHTGRGHERDGDYFGPAVNRAARLMAAGHGGQVLVSNAVAELVSERVPLRDLGEHWLRDLTSVARVWQAMAPGLEDDFPPLRTLDGARSNLPQQRTSLVGRERRRACPRRDAGEEARSSMLIPGASPRRPARVAHQPVGLAWLDPPVRLHSIDDPGDRAAPPHAASPYGNAVLQILPRCRDGWNPYYTVMLRWQSRR